MPTYTTEEGPCDGSGLLPRAMGGLAGDDTPIGLCVSCQTFQPLDEIKPPSRPEWKREFRVRQHSASQLVARDDDGNILWRSTP